LRIALVNPPLLSTGTVQPPLGLCTLAAWLLRNGHDIELVDLDLETKLFEKDPSTTYRALFSAKMAEFQPDLVAFTSMYNNSLQAGHLIRSAKSCLPHTPTVAGGPHFGAQGAEALNRVPELDFVVEGEGEKAFLALVDALGSGSGFDQVPNLCHRRAGEIRINPRGPLLDLSELPQVWPGIAGRIDLGRYVDTIPREHTRRGLYTEAGRGCPYRCSFCAPAVFWDRRYRVKPPETILQEIAYLHETYGYNAFILVHDLLTVDRRFVETLCDAFLTAKLPVRWMANARTDLEIDDLLPAMREAGCWKLFFGIESGSERMQRKFDKHLSAEESFEVVLKAEQAGIDVTCSFVVGHPDETDAELSQSIKLGARMRLIGSETVQFHRLRLFPPAPMTKSGYPMEFDVETLRLEYPFKDIESKDLVEIADSPEFFSGYFSPLSRAGRSHELAQIELFFTQAIALTPMTVATLVGFASEGFVSQFYDLLEATGTIDRFAFDPTSVDLVRNFDNLEPYVRKLIRLICREQWQDEIASSILDYEAARLFTLYGHRRDRDGWTYHHDRCLQLDLRFDPDSAIRQLQRGEVLAADAAAPKKVLLVLNELRSLAVYQI
jgi:radical SAM superfamily enzyme YgiQ (UPF0313 family)